MKSDNRGKWPCRLIGVFGFAVFAAPAVLAAPGDPLGPPFGVETSGGRHNRFPAVARSLGTGDFVIAWETDASNNDSFSVLARRFRSDGTPDAADFTVNDFISLGSRTSAAVAMDDAGDFVVAWRNGSSAGTSIWARRYSASGRAGVPIQIASVGSISGLGDPSVAMDGDGEFVVAWAQFPGTSKLGKALCKQGSLLCSGTTEVSSVRARRFTARGLPAGSEVVVDSVPAADRGKASNGESPHVAMAADGSFVVAWSRSTATPVYGTFVRPYSAAGVAGAVRQVSGSKAEFALHDPVIAMAPDGDFVLVYSQDQYQSDTPVLMQRFDATAKPLGGTVQIDGGSISDQEATAAVAASGDFIVAWTSLPEYGTNVCKAQRYDAGGKALGGVIQLSAPNQYAVSPTVAFAGDGGFVAGWSTLVDEGIEARLFSGN